MDYFIAGGGKIKLTDTDFVTEGGEGKIYLKNQWIYKIFHDTNKVIPAAKIQELAVLDLPHIIRPQSLVLNKQNIPVGFTMLAVTQATAMSRLFTNDFRNQHQITDKTIFALITHLQETIAFIHSKGCLLVDGNEMNFLVDEKGFERAYFIDVDSYQTPSFPATALMPSIRDYHTQGFSQLTDWFAFAILSCQLLIGIHPYKGKHPNFKKQDLPARMQANISIFNKSVSLPAAVRDFSVIPTAWRDWYIRLFEKGERFPPPSLQPVLLTTVLPATTAQDTTHFIITLIVEMNEVIQDYYSFQGKTAIFAGKHCFFEKMTIPLNSTHYALLYEPKTLTPVLATIQGDFLHLHNISTQKLLNLQINAKELLQVGNQLYVVWHDKLTEIKMTQLSNQLIATTGTSWSILPHAHFVGEGAIYENILGKAYLVIPYANACMIQAIPELNSYKIVSLKQDKGVVMVIGHKDSQYDLLIFRFDEQYQQYNVRILENRDVLTLNFVTLENGLVIHIPEDGEAHIFHRRGDTLKIVQDPHIYTTMHLTHDGMRVLFYQDKRLYQLKMR